MGNLGTTKIRKFCDVTVLSIYVLSLFSLVSCRAEPIEKSVKEVIGDHGQAVNGSEKNGCATPSLNLGSLPEMVLVGTDVQSRSAYKLSEVGSVNVRSETGGADIEVTITRNSHGKYDAVRNYKEPGTAVDVREVKGFCLEGTTLFTDEVVVQFVVDGVLWLELDGQNAMISNELWVLLTKE